MLEQLKTLMQDEEAPTAVEYGLMVAGIAVAVVAIVFTLGKTVNDKFTDVNDHLVAGK